MGNFLRVYPVSGGSNVFTSCTCPRFRREKKVRSTLHNFCQLGLAAARGSDPKKKCDPLSTTSLNSALHLPEGDVNVRQCGLLVLSVLHGSPGGPLEVRLGKFASLTETLEPTAGERKEIVRIQHLENENERVPSEKVGHSC